VTSRQKAAFWIGLIIVGLLFLYAVRGILLPFVVGMAIAYLADPLADKLEKWGLSRAVATTLITVIFFAVVAVALILITPLIAGQLLGLVQRLPLYFERASSFVVPIVNELLAKLPTELNLTDISIGREALGKYAQDGLKWLLRLLSEIWSGGLAMVNLVSLLVITPVVAFYLLWEWDAIVATIDSWLPRRQADAVRRIVSDIDSVLSGFVRGQAMVCVILAAFYGVSLSLVGLEFGFVIGVASGALSFIPFVGAIFGAVASVGVALVQFWPDYIWIGAVAAIYGVGQILEGNVLTPKLVGGKVGLHPVWVIFGLLAGGVLFGFVGMLLAVPLTAVIGVVARFAITEYLDSRFYHHGAPADEGEDPGPQS